MKNRENIKFGRIGKLVTGSLTTESTFVLAKGETRKEVRKQIKVALKEF